MKAKQILARLQSDAAGLEISRLLEPHAPSLAGWYGNPVGRDIAEVLAAAAQDELRTRLCAGGACFQLYVLMLACEFHRHGESELEYQHLAAATCDRRERALLELVYGQLLVSRKCSQAMAHLERGFSLAAEYLASTDYFHLVRQHELLHQLSLSSRHCEPLELESLLTEAAVIRRLRPDTIRVCEHAHYDTLG